MPHSDLIGYACYGSNMLEERFLCYIQGGRPRGTHKFYAGCRDKTPPKKSQPIRIPRPIYFAQESQTWQQGGVAFIATAPDVGTETLGRLYFITRGQFIELVQQETHLPAPLNIDFENIARRGSGLVQRNTWYGNILYLGKKAGYPVFTFTNEIDLKTKNAPSPNYLSTILRGLKETYPDFSAQKLINYLLANEQIEAHYSPGQLQEMF